MPRALLIAVAVLLLAGCETVGYYSQAVRGHFSLMSAAQPVEQLLADPQVPADLKARLELARSIRDFATRVLRLPDNGSYRSYAQLPRPFAVWNVVAAPEFSLEAVQSCFPVAGCVAYRGFFARADAERYAKALRESGHDVYVYGVAAYSTLGRFDDPLLSTFIQYREPDLARLLFHELAHQVAYAKDDSTFNESFAVVVEREGARRWFEARQDAQALGVLAETERRSAEFVALLEGTRERLGALYRSRVAPEAMRERKRAEMAELKAKLAAYPRVANAEPSNAFLAAHATYTRLVPEFQKLLAEERGDLERFYERVRALAASAPSSRGPLSAQPR